MSANARGPYAPKPWVPEESPLFVAMLKHLGSDCTTTGAGRAALMFRNGDDVVQVTVEVVKPGRHGSEFITTRGEPVVNSFGFLVAPGV